MPPPRCNDGQAEVDAALDQSGHLGLGVGVSTTKGYSTRQSVASVTWLTREAVKLMLSPPSGPSDAAHLAAQVGHILKEASKRCTAAAAACSRSPTRASRSASLSGVRRFAPRPGGAQGLHELAAALGLSSRSSCGWGGCAAPPRYRQHLVQHARRAARLALLAQLLQGVPGLRPAAG